VSDGLVAVGLVVVGSALIPVGRSIRRADLLRPPGERNRDGAVLVVLLIATLTAGAALSRAWGFPRSLLAVWTAFLVLGLGALALDRRRQRAC
jgi:hypothetical protein